MFPFYINSDLSKFFSINNSIDSDSIHMENESIEGNPLINLNSSIKSEEKAKEEEEKVNKCFLSNNYSNGFSTSCFSESSLLSLLDRENNDSDEKSDLLFFINNLFHENIEKNKNSFFSLGLSKNKKKKIIFKITYSPKHSLFTKTKVDNTLDEGDEKEKEEPQNFLKKKRIKSRKENKDNIRKKIKRGFLNKLCENLKGKLRIIGSNEYFTKFPQFFASDVHSNRNKIILDMTLQEIFENSELYIYEDKNGYANYKHNFKVVKKIKNNDIFKKILSKTFKELYEEYLDSDEFNIDEINRLKKSKMENEYIRRYKDIAKDLINFFVNNI